MIGEGCIKRDVCGDGGFVDVYDLDDGLVYVGIGGADF